MAIKPDNNETFYREVDDELRREQMTSVWRRYGKAIIAGAVLLLALIGGIIWWQNRQEALAGERGEQLTALFEDIQANRTKDAPQRLDQLAKEGGPGYRAAALLTKGDMAVQAGKDAEAAAAFKAIADDADLPAPYRELGLIRQTAVEFDTLQPAAIAERLRPLAVAGNPWFGSAGEMLALSYMKQGKPELAGPIFAAMAKDKQLPPSMRSRAVQMAGALGLDAVPDTQAAGEAGATKDAQ